MNVLFTCDLYNEGVDLPFVDILLLLRPTQSATLFLQQLGRGLRHHTGKSSCLVLDFIGQHRDEFRFDVTLSAVTGIPRARLRKAIEDGFPFLPSGCALQLDAVSRDQILASLRSTIAGAKRLTSELRELAAADNARPRLSKFLEETGRELDDVYDAGGWTKLQRGAGLVDLADGEDADEIEDLSRRLGFIQHVDEPDRLRSYREEPAHDRLDPGARELDTNIRGHWLVRASLREATNLLDERAAKIGVLKAPSLHDVVRPRPGIHVGVAGTEVTLDLVGDSRGDLGHGHRGRRIPSGGTLAPLATLLCR